MKNQGDNTQIPSHKETSDSYSDSYLPADHHWASNHIMTPLFSGYPFQGKKLILDIFGMARLETFL